MVLLLDVTELLNKTTMNYQTILKIWKRTIPTSVYDTNITLMPTLLNVKRKEKMKEGDYKPIYLRK